MMQLRLGSVPVFVSDVERSLAFYRDTLGFEVTMDMPFGPDWRWVTVAQGPGQTELILFHPSKAVLGSQATAVEQRIGTWTGIVLLTDDIQASYQAMIELGVEVAGPPRQQPWGGWETSFSDPDGNRFHLAQR